MGCIFSSWGQSFARQRYSPVYLDDVALRLKHYGFFAKEIFPLYEQTILPECVGTMGRRRLPPLKALVPFEAAARLESLTRAAEELHLTQAAISRQIRLLEEALDCRLFIRHHRNVRPTQEGRELYHTVAMALAHIGRAADQIRPCDSHRAKVTVATDQAVAVLWLLPRIGEFRAQNPDIDIRLVASDEDRQCLATEVDVAVIHGDGEWQDHNADLLFDEEIFPVCSPEYIRLQGSIDSVSDLVTHQLIDLEDDHWKWTDWGIWLTEKSIELPTSRQRLSINSYPLVIDAACRSHGVALGWKYLVDEEISKGRLIRPIEASLTTGYGYYVLSRPGACERDEVYTVWKWLLYNDSRN